MEQTGPKYLQFRKFEYLQENTYKYIYIFNPGMWNRYMSVDCNFYVFSKSKCLT